MVAGGQGEGGPGALAQAGDAGYITKHIRGVDICLLYLDSD